MCILLNYLELLFEGVVKFTCFGMSFFFYYHFKIATKNIILNICEDISLFGERNCKINVF